MIEGLALSEPIIMSKNISILERYQRVFEISRDLASTLDLTTLLDRIVHAAADLSDALAASILLYDETTHQLRFEAATNMDQPQNRGIMVPVDNSVAGWIVTHKRPVMVSNTQNDPRHYKQIGKSTGVLTSSLLGVPLIAKDKTIGVLEAINKRAGDFTEEDQEILITLGAQAAVAIENARLFQQSDSISVLMHEFRTPLSMISTSAQLFSRPGINDDQKAQMMEIILREAQRLTKMTSSYLDVARLESGRALFDFADADIRSILLEGLAMIESQAHEKNISLRSDIPEEMPQVWADQDRIKQVVINLLSNAVKYTPADGVIMLSAYSIQDAIMFSVSDTGIGIPTNAIPKLFEKFYRVPGAEQFAKGTGLGLSICKHIIEAHGGRISIVSDYGSGSTFKVKLPLQS